MCVCVCLYNFNFLTIQRKILLLAKNVCVCVFYLYNFNFLIIQKKTIILANTLCAQVWQVQGGIFNPKGKQEFKIVINNQAEAPAFYQGLIMLQAL